MTFRVRQKVVCIKGRFAPLKTGFMPVTGGIYTVRGFFLGQCDGAPRIWLEEYVHPEIFQGLEIGWDAARFRPIVERKTDIGVFTATLTGVQDWGRRMTDRKALAALFRNPPLDFMRRAKFLMSVEDAKRVADWLEAKSAGYWRDMYTDLLKRTDAQLGVRKMHDSSTGESYVIDAKGEAYEPYPNIGVQTPDDDFELPCDVTLPSPTSSLLDPSVLILKGCRLSTLVRALRERAALSPDTARGREEPEIGAIHSALAAANIPYTGYSSTGVNLIGDSKSIREVHAAFHSHGQADGLKTQIRHWREECGKLHAQLAQASSSLPSANRGGE